MDLHRGIAAMQATACSPADAGAAGKERSSTGNEAQATLMACCAEHSSGVAATRRVRHLPERVGATVRSILWIHVATAERKTQPVGACAQANAAGIGHHRIRRPVLPRAPRRLAHPGHNEPAHMVAWSRGMGYVSRIRVVSNPHVWLRPGLAKVRVYLSSVLNST